MLVYFGTKATPIAQGNLSHSCPGCTEGDINMYVFQKYAHIYWIPFFKTTKAGVAECTSCHKVYQDYEFPLSFDTPYRELSSTAKSPWWVWSGFMLIGAIVIAVMISSKINDNKNAELILAPQSGDIYEVKLGESQYTVYKVDRIEGDMVYIFENQYECDMASGFTDLKSKPYYEDSYPVSKASLEYMLENGEIQDIDR